MLHQDLLDHDALKIGITEALDVVCDLTLVVRYLHALLGELDVLFWTVCAAYEKDGRGDVRKELLGAAEGRGDVARAQAIAVSALTCDVHRNAGERLFTSPGNIETIWTSA
jgi:hypothetical protein